MKVGQGLAPHLTSPRGGEEFFYFSLQGGEPVYVTLQALWC